MLSNRQWWRTNLVTFSFLFIILTLCIFLPYWTTGTSLVWQSDGITQHLPALAQWQNDLKNLFATGTWPSQWSWHIGLGADYYQTFSYYTLGDIFTYAVAFFSTNQLLAYYEGFILIRLALAGLACLWAIKHFTDSTNPWINSIASVAYTFTGYTAFAAFEHPFFINPLIILPLLLISFDTLQKKGKLLPFTFMVFWTLWNNYYFAFMILLGLAIYWLVTTTIHHEWLNWQLHLKMLLSGIIGSLMAMLLFLPNVLGVLSSSRSGAPLANGLLVYPFYYYAALPGTFIGNTATPNFWFTGGFTTIFILALIFILRRWREFPALAAIFTISGIGLLIPTFAAIFNGGSSPSNRWTFLLALPFALATVYFLNRLEVINKIDWNWFIGVGIIMSLSLFITTDFSFKTHFGLIIALYFMTLFVISAHNHWSDKTRWMSLALVTVINLMVIMTINHETDLNPNKTAMLSRDTVQKLLKQQTKYPAENGQPLQRSLIADPLQNAKGIAPGNNLAMLSKAHAIDSYWSFQNGKTNESMSQLGVLTSTNNDVVSDLNRRSVLAHTLGIKDLYLNKYDQKIGNYDKAGRLNNQIHYTTDSAYPLAYVAPNVVSTKSYESTTPSQREAILADSVVTDALPEKFEKSSYANKLLSGKISLRKNAVAKNKLHYTYRTQLADDKTGIYLMPDKQLKNTELHLELSNIKFTPSNFDEMLQNDLASYAAKHDELDVDMQYNPEAFKWNWYKEHLGQYGSAMGGYSITTTYNGDKQKFTQTSQKNLSFFNPRSTATINLGKSVDTSDPTFIPLKFSQPGTYSFDAKIIAMPIDNRFNDVAHKVQAKSVPLKLQRDHISGEISVDEPTIITTSIPFSAGWHSKSNEIINVNSGFIGMKVKSGTTKINLDYQTPGLRIGMQLSALGLIMFIVLGIYERIKTKRSHA